MLLIAGLTIPWGWLLVAGGIIVYALLWFLGAISTDCQEWDDEYKRRNP